MPPKKLFSSSRGNYSRDEKMEVTKQYAPLTEVSFYILMALCKERHGYEVMQWTNMITDGELELQGGTLYNSLARLEHNGLVEITREDDRRKYYQITPLGKKVLQAERMRLERLYTNSRDKIWRGRQRLNRSIEDDSSFFQD